MPKFPTFPILYDDVLKLSISKLKEWHYLEPEQIKSGSIHWNTNGNQKSNITIRVNTQSEQPYIELNYLYHNTPRNYKIQLVTQPSNLGKGQIWYFKCPVTKKHCRKLYLINGYFLHREAFNGCMYKTQTQSKKAREIEKKLRPLFKKDYLSKELDKKYFKKVYAGKPTKRYLRLMKQVQEASKLTLEEVINMMFK